MTELDPDTRIIVVRRGETMRVVFPMTTYGLETTSAPELALSAATLFFQLQGEFPGRADEPITSKTGQMGLALPFADDLLDDDEPLWAILAGHWQDYELDVLGPVQDDMQKFPGLALNLVDITHT